MSAAATTVATAEPTTTAVESATTAAEAATAVVTTAGYATAVIATCRAAREGMSATGVTGRTTVIASPSPGIANAAAISIPHRDSLLHRSIHRDRSSRRDPSIRDTRDRRR